MDRPTLGLAVAVVVSLTTVASAASRSFPTWKVWTAPDAAGVMTPHYSVSLDGEAFSEPRATTYDLTLRYGPFDPLDATQSPPRIPASLTAPAEASLHIVQFHVQPLEPFREVLRALGADVCAYLAHHSHVVRMNPAVRAVVRALPFVRWVGPFHPAYKLDESILAALQGARPEAITGHYSIQVFERGLGQQNVVADRIAALGGSVISKADDGFRMTVTLTLDQVRAIASMDEVHFIDPWGPGEHDMDIVRQLSGATPTLAQIGLTGRGVRAEVFDSEVDPDHPEWDGQTPQYNGPVGDAGTHGSSVYGICFSTGVVLPTATGLLPDREQGIFNFYRNATQFGGPTTRLAQNKIATDPHGPFRSVFQTSSVGSPRTSQYTTMSAETDDYLFQVDYLSCQSMSNANLVPLARPQAWAKNIVSVGGVNHWNSLARSDDLSAGSSGPAADGRIKPDLAHVYDSIFTTTDGGGYTQFGGTSGATPCACGAFGLFFQMWHEQAFAGFGGGASVFDSRCRSTTAKAMLINTAFRYDWNDGGANGNMTRVRQGWGMVDLAELYNYRERILIVDETDVLTNFSSTSYEVVVELGEPVLRATMVYLDPPGSPISAVHRVNDLNLRVTAPTGIAYWGNHGLSSGNFSTSGGAPNTLDTVENVFVRNPAPGTWTVEVIAAEINEDAHLETPAIDADYALVVTGVRREPVEGACCIETTCFVATENDCHDLSGVYRGHGTSCQGKPCGGDTIPPLPPSRLVAAPGDSLVLLDWADNVEQDLAGYNVYRALTPGGPYVPANLGLVIASDFADRGIVNGSTYFYVVTAVDIGDNESGVSAEIAATPRAGDPVTMHVGAITPTLEDIGPGNRRGRVDVTMLDEFGDPVAGATVAIVFSGPFDETVVAVTGASGIAVARTGASQRGWATFFACIDDATHATLRYQPVSNIETCDAR